MIAAATTAACDISDPVRFGDRDASVLGCPLQLPPDARVYADNDCFADPCVARASQDGCAFRVELGQCTTAEISGTVLPSGGFDPTFASPALGACRAVPGPGLVRFECASCNLDLYRGPFDAPFTADPVSISSPPFVTPQEDGLLEGLEAFEGYLGGAAVLRDRVVVVSYEDRYARFGCEGREVAQLYFVDPERLEARRAIAAPPCTTRLLEDPFGEGFYAAYGVGATKIGRFDRDGRMVATSTIGLGTRATMPVSLDISKAGHAIVVTFTSSVTPPSPVTAVNLRLEGLPIIARQAPLAARLRGADFQGEEWLALSDATHGRLELVDATAPGSWGQLPLPPARGISTVAGAVLHHVQSARFAVSTSGAHPGLWLIRPFRGGGPELYGIALPWELRGGPWAVAKWEKKEELLVLGLLAPDLTASAVLLDPVAVRYLPGAVPIGRGVVSQILTGDGTTMWAVLPWQSRVVRLSPK